MAQKFVLKAVLLLLPLLLGFFYMEYYCRTETTFAKKAHWLKNHLPETEIIILGSSHCQDGIDPSHVSDHCSNMAFGGQTLSVDFELLNLYSAKLKNLKWLILDVSPHRFYMDIIENDWNHRIYRVMHGIRYKTEDLNIDNYSLVLSDFSYFSNVVWQGIRPWGEKAELTEFGFPKNDIEDRFAKLNFDSAAVNNSFSMYYRFTDTAMFRKNFNWLENMLDLTQKRGINVLLLAPPVYQTFYNGIPQTAYTAVDSAVSIFKKKYRNVQYLNLTKSSDYNLTDFKNDNHLNLVGAEKLTFAVKNSLKED